MQTECKTKLNQLPSGDNLHASQKLQFDCNAIGTDSAYLISAVKVCDQKSISNRANGSSLIYPNNAVFTGFRSRMRNWPQTAPPQNNGITKGLVAMRLCDNGASTCGVNLRNKAKRINRSA